MKIFVTGASGFLGRALALRLHQEGHDVTTYQRSAPPELESQGVRVIRGNLEDASALWPALEGQDLVCHAAALTGIAGRASRYTRINVEGTRHVVEGCLTHGITRLVYTSTPSVVFDKHDLENADESTPFPEKHLAAYAASKAAAEKYVLSMNGRKNFWTVALRPHLIYGPGDTNLIPRVVKRARGKRLIQIGHGDNQVDITYIDNAVEAHVQAIHHLKPESAVAGNAYFISDGIPVRLWDWLSSLLHQLDLPPVQKHLPFPAAYALGFGLEKLWAIGLPGEPLMTRFLALQLAKSHYFNIQAAQRDLHYEPLVSPPEAFSRLVGWCRENLL